MFEISLIVVFIILLLGVLLAAFSKEFVTMLLGLVVALLAIGFLYGLMNAWWPMTVQILLYAGGVIILMLFVIMIVGMDISLLERKNILALVPISGSRLSFVFGLMGALGTGKLLYGQQVEAFKLFRITSQPINIAPMDLGRDIIEKNLLAFELASIVLLLAMIGGVVISRPIRSRRKGP